MRYEDNSFGANEIAFSIHSADRLMTELEKLGDDAEKKSALIDALTLKKITSLYENADASFSRDDALRRSHDESKRNLIKLIGLFPKDRRVALIASSFRSESTIVNYSRSYQIADEVYLKDFAEKVFFEDGCYNNLVNMPDFVWTWESFVKSLAIYVTGKNNEQIENALHDVLLFIPEDSAEQFFKAISVEKLLSLNSLDSLLQKYDFCETLILNGMNNEITKLEDISKILRKIPPNSLKKCYDKLSEKIPALADDINAFAYVLACFPEHQSATLINAAPTFRGVDTLITDHNKLIQVVFNLNPKLRLAFLKNLGVIDSLKAEMTSEKQASKNVLRQLLSVRDQRFEFDRLTRYVAPQAATSDAHRHVLGSANEEFELFLTGRGLDVKKSDDWKKNVEMCRGWIPGLLRDCFLHLTWGSDREFCQQIHHSAFNKLILLAETGRYPEAELAMLMVSLAENKPVEAGYWLEKFKAWNTWFAWDEYKNNRRVMKGLTVACQEFHERLDFEFNCPMSITNDKRNDIFSSLVNTVRIVLSHLGDADKQRILDYFKSPAFNCLTDEDIAKYKGAVIVQKVVELPLELPLAVPLEKDTSPFNLDGEKLPPTIGKSANFFNAHSRQKEEMLAIVAGLVVPSNALPVVGTLVVEEEVKKLLV